MSFFYRLSKLSLIAVFTVALSCNFISADEELGIGSPAPDLDIEHWLSDNDGYFEHVSKLEEGKVYVIEFWATWCGPCIAQMPHISKLQKKHKDDIQIISVSDEDIDTVKEFLERKVRGDKEKRTYGELTNNYCLTTDPDESVYDEYFRAAGQTGIPTAFIVGKTKEIEWIGHPMDIDKPLEEIIADKWDRAAYKEAYLKEIEEAKKQEKAARAINKIMRPLAEKMQQGKMDEVLDGLDEAISENDDETVKDQLKTIRLQLLMMRNHEGLAGALQEFVDENATDDPMNVNNLVWTIYERHVARGDISEDVLKVCLEGAEKAAKAEPESGHILDTLAHLVYVVENDLDRAIELQKKAIKFFDGPDVGDLKKFLSDLEEEKRTGKKPSAKKKKKKKVEESDF
ncbi:MAG: redoxin domain-containing protein [Planctomycetota bacterium]